MGTIFQTDVGRGMGMGVTFKQVCLPNKNQDSQGFVAVMAVIHGIWDDLSSTYLHWPGNHPWDWSCNHQKLTFMMWRESAIVCNRWIQDHSSNRTVKRHGRPSCRFPAPTMGDDQHLSFSFWHILKVFTVTTEEVEPAQLMHSALDLWALSIHVGFADPWFPIGGFALSRSINRYLGVHRCPPQVWLHAPI